jgi:hypothetical protein
MEREYNRKSPSGFKQYQEEYGWHFSKALCTEAVKRMRDRNGAEVRMRDKTMLEDLLKANGVKLKEVKGYDIVYLDAMYRADFFGSSITTEQQLMKHIGDFLNDPDGYDGRALVHYYADCLHTHTPIIWEDML